MESKQKGNTTATICLIIYFDLLALEAPFREKAGVSVVVSVVT